MDLYVLIFYIFLFTNNFSDINKICKAADSSITFIPLTNIKDSFNGHAIWWPNDNWNDVQGVGDSAFYTFDPSRNNGVGGLPTDGKVTIGGLPFILQQNSEGNDCFKLNKSKTTISSMSLSYLFANNTNTKNKSLKFKNIYVMGILTDPDNGEISNDNFEINGNFSYNDGSYSYSRSGKLYDYFSTPDTNTYIQDYCVRNRLNNNYVGSKNGPPNIQCCKFETTSFPQLESIGLTYYGADSDNENKFCCIFAITAEVETDLTSSNVGCRNFAISASYYIQKFEAFKNPNFENDQVEEYSPVRDTTGIICTEEEPETTYYCRITKKSDSTYSYITVTTLPANRLKLTALAPPKIYNGNYQQLINSIQIINTGTKYESKNEDVSTYDDYDKFKENIYLRIKDAGSYDTGWYNLNSLSSLTAMNAGVYYVYYFIDVGTDKLSEYDSEALSAELTQVTVSN